MQVTRAPLQLRELAPNRALGSVIEEVMTGRFPVGEGQAPVSDSCSEEMRDWQERKAAVAAVAAGDRPAVRQQRLPAGAWEADHAGSCKRERARDGPVRCPVKPWAA